MLIRETTKYRLLIDMIKYTEQEKNFQKCSRKNQKALFVQFVTGTSKVPIGGFKEKVLAAHRGGMKTIIIPKENEKDIKEVPAKILKTVDIVMVEHMDEVLKRALILDDPDNFMKKKEDEGLTEKFYEQEGIQEVTNRSVN